MFVIISILLFVVARVFADHDDGYCFLVKDVQLCAWTFGCYWNTDPDVDKCTDQEYYMEGTGTCESTGLGPFPDTDGYDCYYDTTSNSYYIYLLSQYDSCSGDEYISPTAECPATSSGGAICHHLQYDPDNLGALGCYECQTGDTDPVCTGCADEYAPGCRCAQNPWSTGCYSNTTNAGICENRKYAGCSSIPFCHYNASSCQPDWKCYYTYWNTSPQVCDTTSSSSGGAGCYSKLVGSTLYCTSDSITSTDEKCILAGTDKDTCETAGCEWVPSGSTTTAGSFTSWCTEIGSAAYITRVSSVLMVLLSIMFTFL